MDCKTLGSRFGFLSLLASLLAAPSYTTADEVRFQVGPSVTDAILRTRTRELLEDSSVTAFLDKLSGGDGTGVSLSLWLDKPRPQGALSYGLEIFDSRSDPSATFTLIQGTNSLTLSVFTDAEFTTAFFNMARRYDFGNLHPYFGAGVGIGVAEFTPRSPLLDGKLDTLHAGVQALVGLDYDLSESSYVGASIRAYYVDGRPFDVDLQYADRAATFYIGYRF